MPQKPNPTQEKAYLIGGGIASLAAAVYLIRDGHMPGENITIVEEGKLMGGSLDGQTLAYERGYMMRGFRMLDEKLHTCTLDLMTSIPSCSDPQKTVREEFDAFNRAVRVLSRSRLIVDGRVVDAKPMEIGWKDRFAFLRLLFRSEASLGTMRVNEYFTPSFFRSNFWLEFCTVSSFQPWHGMAEFQRYLFRCLQSVSSLPTNAWIRLTPYNQYECLVLPIVQWLQGKGVHIHGNTVVTDIEFDSSGTGKTVRNISLEHEGKEQHIAINEHDKVFVTLGSMTANCTTGSTTEPPDLSREEGASSWDLWEKIARNQPDFGKPSVFHSDIEKTKWVSFTLIFHNPTFFALTRKFSGEHAEIDGPITLKDSPWLLTYGLPPQPHFRHQPKDDYVCWGYGLYPDKEGTYVKKKMSDCTGAEIFTELCGHLGFTEQLPLMMQSMSCVPCMMPYITSQFLPRAKGDRPPVIPKGATNFAFLGQFCEIPGDIVFTIEYSIRSAQTAVYSLLNLRKRVVPFYRGMRHPRVLLGAVRAVFR